MTTTNSPTNEKSAELEAPHPDTQNSMNNSYGKGFDHRGGDGSKSGFDYRHDDRDLDAYDDNNGNKNSGVEMSYLPPDQRGELFSQIVDPGDIDEDTEAAEALRANAGVKVGKVGKAARSLNAQSVRKLAKRVTMRGNSGYRRGKPPRIPPGMTATTAEGEVFMYPLSEEDEGWGRAEDGASESEHSIEHPRDVPPPVAEVKQQPEPPCDKDHPSLAPPLGPQKDTTSQLSPSHGGETDPSRKSNRHSSLLEEAKDIPAEVVAATMEAGRKLMGALDPHNMLQLQRWRRKNGKKAKKKRKSYVKGKVIDGRHELYTLSIAVMLGVRTSIARTNTIIASTDQRTILTAQDFMAEEKYEFAPKGSAITPPHKLSHTFKFKDYAPVAFAYLRRMFGVNEFDFLLSVCGNANFIEFISNAKSGQFFFYSSDGKYMIKTMTNAESKFLRRILPHYFKHCTQNPNTIITKFLGMYRVKLYHLRRNVKFVIMNSVYYTDKSLQKFFDLKGSVLGREAKPGQDVLKDNDLRAKLPAEAMSLSPEVRERLRSQIISDCDFLRRMQIMDYSMLIGIHHIPVDKGDKSHGAVDPGFRIGRGSHRASKRQGSQSNDPISIAAKTVQGEDAGDSKQELLDSGSEHKRESLAKDNKLTQHKGDSTRKLIRDIRESTFSVSNFEFAGLLEEEDDCSYLEGSVPFSRHDSAQSLLKYQQHPRYDDVEMKKEQTVEQIYWPFHRFYDINGLRRMHPKPCFRCNNSPCKCEGHEKLTKDWNIPDFTPPLSNRKDAGLMMDTEGFQLPLTWNGPQGERPCNGKIFYMGIIDILQQYNSRKRVETSFRKMEGSTEPSCVSPDEYAARFVRFFDEYAAQAVIKKSKATEEEEKTEIEIVSSGRDLTDGKDVQIEVGSSGKYDRAPLVERDADGKPIPPKGRVIVT